MMNTNPFLWLSNQKRGNKEKYPIRHLTNNLGIRIVLLPIITNI